MKKAKPYILTIIFLLCVGYGYLKEESDRVKRESRDFIMSGELESRAINTKGQYDSITIDGLPIRYPISGLAGKYQISDKYGDSESGGGYILGIQFDNSPLLVTYTPLRDPLSGTLISDKEFSAQQKSTALSFADELKKQYYSTPTLVISREQIGEFLITKYTVSDHRRVIYMYCFKSANYFISLTSEKPVFSHIYYKKYEIKNNQKVVLKNFNHY